MKYNSFYLSSDQKILLGVFGGISHKFGFNPLVIRIIAVIAVILLFSILIGGLCVAGYFLLGFILPAKPTINIARPVPSLSNFKRQHSNLEIYHIICWIFFIIAIITCLVATIDFFDSPKSLRKEYSKYLLLDYFSFIFSFFHAIFVGIVKDYIIRNSESS